MTILDPKWYPLSIGGSELFPNLSFVKLDLSDYAAMSELFKEIGRAHV